MSYFCTDSMLILFFVKETLILIKITCLNFCTDAQNDFMIALCYDDTFYDSTDIHFTSHRALSSIIDQSDYNCIPILQFYAIRFDFKVKPVQISIYR